MSAELKYSLATAKLTGDTKTKVIETIQQIPDYGKLRLEHELTLLGIRIVEDNITKKSKVDKKKLLLEAMVDVFNLTEEEQKVLGEQIEFFHGRKMIRKSKFAKVVWRVVSSWVLKKFG